MLGVFRRCSCHYASIIENGLNPGVERSSEKDCWWLLTGERSWERGSSNCYRSMDPSQRATGLSVFNCYVLPSINKVVTYLLTYLLTIWLCFVLCDYIRSQFFLANPAAPFGRL